MKKFISRTAVAFAIAALIGIVATPATQAQQPAIYPTSIYSLASVASDVVSGATANAESANVYLTRYDELMLEATITANATNGSAALSPVQFALGKGGATNKIETTPSVNWSVPLLPTGTNTSYLDSSSSNTWYRGTTVVVTNIYVGAVGYLQLQSITNANYGLVNVQLQYAVKPRRHGEQ